MKLPLMHSALLALAVVLSAFSTVSSEEKKGAPESKPLLSIRGEQSRITKHATLRIANSKQWDRLWTEHKTGQAEPNEGMANADRAELDFDKVMAIALFYSEGYGGVGPPTVESIREVGNRIVIRVDHHNRQTGTSGDDDLPPKVVQPWGIFILPRSDREVILEENRGALGETKIWKEYANFPEIKAVGK